MSRADFENYIKFYRLEKENCFFSRKYWEKTMSIVMSQGKIKVKSILFWCTWENKKSEHISESQWKR